METLQDATVNICDLKGNMLAVEAFLTALIRVLPAEALLPLQSEHAAQMEIAQAVLLGAMVSEHTRSAFERDSQRLSASLQQRLDRLR
ncbi:MAG: hypothetical protein JSS56_04795 [Proteobacteria bacterium]|nr:hypothetical protein [Pseudomonadota bacterium]